MQLSGASLAGRVTFVTGPGKDSGKTTLLGHLQALARGAGEAPALLGVGFDGERRDALTAARKPRIGIAAGEACVTALRFLEAAGIDPEIFGEFPARGGFGRLAAARARRPGAIVLVGPEGNDQTAEAIRLLVEEGGARTVLVDGAMNRVTQVAGLPGARFVFTLRVGPAELGKQASRARLVTRLASLPVMTGQGGLPEGAFAVAGPLTAETAARVPEKTREVIVEDLTKVFLDERSLAAFTRGRELLVRRGIEFGGIVVALRDVDRDAFLRAIGDPEAESRIAWNPFEAEAVDGLA